jgi:hypothetical protein
MRACCAANGICKRNLFGRRKRRPNFRNGSNRLVNTTRRCRLGRCWRVRRLRGGLGRRGKNPRHCDQRRGCECNRPQTPATTLRCKCFHRTGPPMGIGFHHFNNLASSRGCEIHAFIVHWCEPEGKSSGDQRPSPRQSRHRIEMLG